MISAGGEWQSAKDLVLKHIGKRALEWGTPAFPGTKPLEGETGSLQSEVLKGESTIKEKPIPAGGSEVIRTVGVVQVTVTRRDTQTGRRQMLVEDRQEFRSGTTRRRGFNYLGEKLDTNEEPIDGAYRAVEEELGLELIRPAKGQPERVEAAPAQVNRKDSSSYPGLTSEYALYPFAVELTSDEVGKIKVNAKGEHEERQSDKTTYFRWQDIN